MSFGERLKEARNKKKLTQVEAAEKIGIDDTTISKYENNKSEPDNETLKKLSSLYNCSIDYLLGKTPVEEETLDLEQEPFKIFEILENYTDDEIINNFYHTSKGLGVSEENARQFISYARFLMGTQSRH